MSSKLVMCGVPMNRTASSATRTLLLSPDLSWRTRCSAPHSSGPDSLLSTTLTAASFCRMLDSASRFQVTRGARICSNNAQQVQAPCITEGSASRMLAVRHHLQNICSRHARQLSTAACMATSQLPTMQLTVSRACMGRPGLRLGNMRFSACPPCSTRSSMSRAK